MREPEFYVLPVAWVQGVLDPENKWGKITRNRLAGIQQYENAWGAVREFLAAKAKR